MSASYYAPLLGELRALRRPPLRVEVPMVGTHWESVYLPEHGSILLARGWERQLDTRYAALFYEAKGTHALRGGLPGVAVGKRGSPTWRCPTRAWISRASRRGG